LAPAQLHMLLDVQDSSIMAFRLYMRVNGLGLMVQYYDSSEPIVAYHGQRGR
jgi:hypothetical protein